MYRRIIAGYDGSERAQDALALGKLLADASGAGLVVVGSSQHSRAGQVLPGDVGTRLLHDSPCSIAVAPHGYADGVRGSLEEIVVGYEKDGAPHQGWYEHEKEVERVMRSRAEQPTKAGSSG